jgi:hypothetical protein
MANGQRIGWQNLQKFPACAAGETDAELEITHRRANTNDFLKKQQQSNWNFPN